MLSTFVARIFRQVSERKILEIVNDTLESDLLARLEVAKESLRKAEERATAGMLALELMHEIRNPLEALGHLTLLARDEADNPDKVREYMRLAEEQMTNLRQVTSQTLGFTRVSDETRAIDFVALAEAALRIHQRAIDAKKVHLVKDLPERLVAKVYTGEMLQVVSNLIVNALDALPSDGTICLRLKKRQGEVHLLIADNGHGIHPRHVHRIFQPFFTTKGERGTGLGLCIIKKIIDHHSGRISIRSSVQPHRSGTLFKISIPA